MISGLPKLHYLDDKPVFELDRLAADAWLKGGVEYERKVREEYL